MPLRDYQEQTLQKAQEAFRESHSVLITAPTGAGKTVMFSEAIRRALQKGALSDILVHREELLIQSRDTVAAMTGVTPGIVWRDRKEWDAPVRVLAHGTVLRADGLPPDVRRPDILFVDEAHHATAPGWKAVIEQLNPRWLVGFTATPFRQDKTPLTPDPFEHIIQSVTPGELIEMGLLVPPVVVSPGVSDPKGEPQSIGKACNLPQIYLQAVRHALQDGRSKIILYVSATPSMSPTEVGHATRSLLHNAGIPTGLIHEKMSSQEREAARRAFQLRPTAVLCNFMTLTEGFDSPAVDCVILGRATGSESTLIQMIGRGLRLHENKQDCLVIDFTGRTDVHDVINYWRLDGPKGESDRDKRTRSNEVTEQDLNDLETAFPRVISGLAETTADYPWLQPFPGRRCRMLRLWDPTVKTGGDRYIVTEPTLDRQWQVTNISIPRNRGAVQTVTRAGLTSLDAAQSVLDALGDRQNLYRRDAPWRRQTASAAQRRYWRRLHDCDPPDDLTCGDASDAIATMSFRERISPRLI